MKKFIVLFLMLISFSFVLHAETYWYRSTSFASATISNGRYYWSDWEQSNIPISIDLTNDIITIYSKVKQIYYVVKCGDTFTDNGGGSQVVFYVVDQDRDRGSIRLRKERNGNSQIYIDFKDCGWCYNVLRIN